MNHKSADNEKNVRGNPPSRLVSVVRSYTFCKKCWSDYHCENCGNSTDYGIEKNKKQNKTKQNKTKQNKTKQNKTKQNRTEHDLPSSVVTNLNQIVFDQPDLHSAPKFEMR